MSFALENNLQTFKRKGIIQSYTHCPMEKSLILKHLIQALTNTTDVKNPRNPFPAEEIGGQNHESGGCSWDLKFKKNPDMETCIMQ